MKFIFKQQTDSTNQDALALPEGADHVGIVADTQTAGRGRSGRYWISPKGNLFVSFCVAVDNLKRAADYSFIAATALAKTLEQFGALPKCKWPNDLLVDGKKISGILLETNGKNRVVVGIGVNIVPVDAKDLLYPVTSLADLGIKVERQSVLECLADQFEKLENAEFSDVLEEWKKRAYGLGRQITVNLPDRQIKGIFYGLDTNGILLLKCADNIIKITAGDVFFGNI